MFFFVFFRRKFSENSENSENRWTNVLNNNNNAENSKKSPKIPKILKICRKFLKKKVFFEALISYRYRIVWRKKPSYRIDIVSSRKKAYRSWVMMIMMMWLAKRMRLPAECCSEVVVSTTDPILLSKLSVGVTLSKQLSVLNFHTTWILDGGGNQELDLATNVWFWN